LGEFAKNFENPFEVDVDFRAGGSGTLMLGSRPTRLWRCWPRRRAPSRVLAAGRSEQASWAPSWEKALPAN